MNGLDHAAAVSRIEPSRVPVMSFASKVPVSTLDSMDEIATTKANAFGQLSVVGTITLLQNCVIVWVGWGESDEVLHDSDAAKTYLQSSFGQSQVRSQKDSRDLPTNTRTRVSLGNGNPVQGHCTVAMPRATSYKGAFATGPKDLPCSQIIGGGSTDAQVLSAQMASRLSAKLCMAIFVSCQLTNEISSESDESSIVPPLAAAAAEKEIIKVIKSELTAQKC